MNQKKTTDYPRAHTVLLYSDSRKVEHTTVSAWCAYVLLWVVVVPGGERGENSTTKQKERKKNHKSEKRKVS